MQTTLTMTPTKYFNPYTLSSNHQSCATSTPTKLPIYLLPITIFNPYPQKKAYARGRFHEDTTNMILVGYGKDPPRGPLTTRSS